MVDEWSVSDPHVPGGRCPLRGYRVLYVNAGHAAVPGRLSTRDGVEMESSDCRVTGTSAVTAWATHRGRLMAMGSPLRFRRSSPPWLGGVGSTCCRARQSLGEHRRANSRCLDLLSPSLRCAATSRDLVQDTSFATASMVRPKPMVQMISALSTGRK